MKFLRKIWREIRDIRFTVLHILLPAWNAYRSGGQLKRESAEFRKLRSSDLVAVVPFYGKGAMLSACLAHHRYLGVNLFVLLDLSEAGGLATELTESADCVVWRPRGDIQLKRALLWLNYLRRRYATGRWCLSIEPSDFIAFHHSETRKLKDLVEFIENERRNHVFGVVVEMYSDRPAAELTLQPGGNPRDLLRLFDPLGYETAKPGRLLEVAVRGGPQRRRLFPSIPRRSPALNRVPLVKWEWYFSYGAGTRVLMPRKLNQPHAVVHSNPTLCLLNYAQLNDDAVLGRAAQAESDELVSGAGDPIYPGISKLRRLTLKTEVSTVLGGSGDLLKAGLLNPGQWF
jgi:Glycosyl transferase family 2